MRRALAKSPLHGNNFTDLLTFNVVFGLIVSADDDIESKVSAAFQASDELH